MAQQPSAYPTPGGSANNTGTQTNSNTNQSTNSSQNTNSNSNSNTNTSKNTTVNNQNMSGSSLAALEALIAQLLGGGTQQQAQETATRQQEIGAVQGIRGGYGKSDAFADATGAMSQQLRKAMESLLPSLVRSAEGSGTSQNSMRALLLQDAMTKAAESSSALGLKASVDYGNISTGLSNTLEALTRPQNKVVDSLLNALGIAKGAVTTSNTNEIGNSSTTQSASQTVDTVSNTNSNSQSQTSPLAYNPNNSFGGTGPLASSNSGGVNYDTNIRAAQELVAQQNGQGSYGSWDSYSF